MKVLHCIPSMAGGGAERQLAYLAKGLVSLGVGTHVALTQGGENHERLLRSGAVVHEIQISNNHSPALPAALHRLIRVIRPQIVQTWLTQMDILGGAAAVWNQVPWVVTERNSAGRYGGGVKDRIRLRVGRRASALVANSATGLAYWKPHLPGATPRRVIANGLPIDEIEQCSALRLEELPVHSPNEKLILFAGRFHPAKNIETLVTALGALRGLMPFKAVLCGQGPEFQKVKAHIESTGMAGQVFLKGYATNLWSWMKKADVFVSVSLSEGHPNTVMEAMASRCPLVVSDIPEHREFLDNSSARLVNPYEPDRITKALAEALTDEGGSLSKAESAARRAAEWSVSSMAQQYLALYQRIVRTVGNRGSRESLSGSENPFRGGFEKTEVWENCARRRTSDGEVQAGSSSGKLRSP